jgi:hypothetical protein
MNRRDAESPRSIPVCADRSCGMYSRGLHLSRRHLQAITKRWTRRTSIASKPFTIGWTPRDWTQTASWEAPSRRRVDCLNVKSSGSGANRSRSGDDERRKRFVPVEALFKGRHFDGQIIILCVSWYTSFKLSLRDLVIMMADRGITLTHTTILRWVQHLCRNSRSAGADMLVRLADPGGWTRHI